MGKYSNGQLSSKFWQLCNKVAKKESIKNSIEELMFFNFMDLPTIFCPRLSKETYFLSLGIQSEWRKIRTRINPNTDTFYAVIFSYFTQPRPEGNYIFDIFLYFKRLIHSTNSYLGRVSCHKDLNLIYFKKRYFDLQHQVQIWY